MSTVTPRRNVWVPRHNPYHSTGKLPMSITPTVSLSLGDLQAHIAGMFDRYRTLSLAHLHNQVTDDLVPVGYRSALDIHGALQAMVEDGHLERASDGGYPAFRRTWEIPADAG